WILDLLSFESGYAVVFGLGALGAAMSTYHLSRIQVPAAAFAQIRPMQDRAQPGRSVGFSGAVPIRLSVGVRLWLTRRPTMPAILHGISPRYWRVMAAYFLFHFTQLMPAALFPIFWVREVNLTDGAIGWVNATFYLTMLTISPFLEPMTKYFGSYRLTAGGAILLALYPLLTAFSTDLTLLLVASICGGVVWAILSGALVNRLLEHCPEDDRPAHLAIYHLALNIAALLGTMLGPLLAEITGLREALLIVFVLRLGSGLALARWG
ncbi:MAG: MFS transporter, partial [Anaerolineae bacterium]|nr:MFS transporter [Anaerolineae bacterium]